MNKYWRPLPEREYLHDMGLPETRTAITVAQFPEGVSKWIWEENTTKQGLVWTS